MEIVAFCDDPEYGTGIALKTSDSVLMAVGSMPEQFAFAIDHMRIQGELPSDDSQEINIHLDALYDRLRLQILSQQSVLPRS